MIKLVLIHYEDTKLVEAQALFEVARQTGWDSVKITCETPDDDYNEYSNI